MFRGMKAFNKEFKDFVNKVPRGGHKVTRKVAKEWFAELVAISPVDTGFFHSKWKWKVNSRPSISMIKHPSPGKGLWPGASTPAFTTFHMGDTLYIYNGVIYGLKLENGHALRVPANFFRNSARRARRRLQQEYSRLKWRNGRLTR